MNSRERMLIAMKNGQPDMVPVAPDMSNMIPCKLTGKPFWDIYLYKNPPRWKAYIDAVKYFDFDGWLDGVPGVFEEQREENYYKKETVIVLKSEERIITREYIEKTKGHKEWSEYITVYYRADPPTRLKASKIGLEATPDKCWPIEGIKESKKDEEILTEVKNYMGNKGVVGVSVSLPGLGNPEGEEYCVYDYYDRYKEVKEWAERYEEQTINRLKRILSNRVKPDFILTGGSGLLIFNTPQIICDLTLPALKKVTALCKEADVPSQIHCCGPERELVKMCAEETDLNSINPLEIPPMGDCHLKEIKIKFGKKLSLMGNLHTTEIMLRGSIQDVEQASKKAIEEAAQDGGFILSTGDQCGRDTPEENILKMIEVARSYGKY